MERVMLISLILFSCLIFTKPAISGDIITLSQSLIYGQTLASPRQVFELGFFSRGTSKKYLGIWYKTTPDVVVWVANRDDPLVDSSGELAIGEKGNLVLLNTTKGVVWSTSSARAPKAPVVAQILDSGNLVLRQNDGVISLENYLWQSFDHPTDTLLAGMKMSRDSKSGRERYLSSWKSKDDPSTGDYTYKMDTNGLPQFVLAVGSTRKFRSGTWNGIRFSGQPFMGKTVFKSYVEISDGESWYMFEPSVDSVVTRLTLNISGSAQRLVLQNMSTEWDFMYSVPYQRCDNYGICGPNSVCGPNYDPICQCLEGFTQSSREEWEVLNWSKGCVRETALDCRKGEGFVEVVGVKLPDLLEFRVNKSSSLKECEEYCLKDCSCKAYTGSDVRGSGCLMWFGDLIDIREISLKDGADILYLRLSASEMKLKHEASKKKRLIITTTVILATLGMVIIIGVVLWCILWKSRKSVKDEIKNDDIELPQFDLATIATATKNFAPTRRIGEGGFGTVYKGRLSTGQEVAVKRLSSNSSQGLGEFKNEVVLISKLQHRNLVAIVGCCVEGEERMLIYEYMCNKSLDSFIFDRCKSASLNWEKRFSIVVGIARGLLYLHQDSKLQIIHRDLKASNILLDNKMNPKISDFGLARIFAGDENELTKTKRVIGTYGYMSPEYAVDGKFSVKSDVFSFGVVLLEIVSGRRNRGFSHPDHHHNLLGHVWLLWSQDKALELLTDASLEDSAAEEAQVLRCIHLGLLCVQKFPVDRPTMAFVVAMLANEGADLPFPKQPAFFTERTSFHENNEEFYTRNDMSTISLEGR